MQEGGAVSSGQLGKWHYSASYNTYIANYKMHSKLIIVAVEISTAAWESEGNQFVSS